MLRMSVRNEEYLMIGDNVKIVFLGGGAGQTRIMIDAPKEINIVRSRALEKRITDPEELAAMPKYYREPEHPEKYKRKPASPEAGKQYREKPKQHKQSQNPEGKSRVVIVRNQPGAGQEQPGRRQKTVSGNNAES